MNLKLAFAAATLLFAQYNLANAVPLKAADDIKDNKKSQKTKIPERHRGHSPRYHYAPGGGVAAVRNIEPEQQAQIKLLTDDVFTYVAGTPVVTSPYLGQRTVFDASDLIVRISTINLDLRLLEQRQRLDNKLKEKNLPLPTVPLVSLSGKLEVGASYVSPYSKQNLADFDLASTELITMVQANPWVTGYVSIAFDHSTSDITGRRLDNSRFYLNKGFLTIGNLNESPVYFTGGQGYVPFGRYNSFMLAAPVTQVIGRTKARFGELGFEKNGFFGAGYVFPSDSGNGSHATSGANLGYMFKGDTFKGEFSVGFISNIADAEGVQGTISGGFGGFGMVRATEDILNRVPAVAVQGSIGAGDYTLIGEFVGATREFNPMDLQYNGDGAAPLGVNVELAKTFTLLELPASVALGYGYTTEALALGLPRNRIVGTFNLVPWRDVIFSLEYRHDINYGIDNTAGGRGVVGCSPLGTSCFVPLDTMGALGHSMETVTAQIGYYF